MRILVGGAGFIGSHLCERLPLQPGDVQRTFADLTKSTAILGYRPSIAIEEGIKRFVSWYRENQEQ